MRRSICQIVLTLLSFLLAAQAMAAQTGWRQIEILGLGSDTPPITVAMYYPTQANARPIAMGPFIVRAAIKAPPDATFIGANPKGFDREAFLKQLNTI